MEFLTKKVSILKYIVMFGFACIVHVNARNKSLGEREKVAIIICKIYETKGYKVYILKEKVVVIKQQVLNIETLTDEQNGQLESHLDRVDRQEGTSNDGESDVQVHPSVKRRVTNGKKDQNFRWTSERHGTRSKTNNSLKRFPLKVQSENTML